MIAIGVGAPLIGSHSGTQHAAGNVKGGCGFHPLTAVVRQYRGGCWRSSRRAGNAPGRAGRRADRAAARVRRRRPAGRLARRHADPGAPGEDRDWRSVVAVRAAGRIPVSGWRRPTPPAGRCGGRRRGAGCTPARKGSSATGRPPAWPGGRRPRSRSAPPGSPPPRPRSARCAGSGCCC